ncbi:MAG: hypothetical protein ACHQ4F_16785 [Candidatus Dormibacteria bacterium]
MLPGTVMKRVIGALGVVAVVLVSTGAGALVIAFHVGARTSVAAALAIQEVKIVRAPGMLALAPLTRMVSAPTLAERLATDVENLPAEPTPWHCPDDFGTTYTLTFIAQQATWTASVDAQHCQTVQIGSGLKRTAANSPQFWRDLGIAVGLSAIETDPTACPGTKPGTIIEGRLCAAFA